MAIKVRALDIKRPPRSVRESRSKWQPSCLYGGVKQKGLRSPYRLRRYSYYVVELVAMDVSTRAKLIKLLGMSCSVHPSSVPYSEQLGSCSQTRYRTKCTARHGCLVR